MYTQVKSNHETLLLIANIPPVNAPLAIEFQGSSFFRTATKAQSILENKPPHTAKLPAKKYQKITFSNLRSSSKYIAIYKIYTHI